MHIHGYLLSRLSSWMHKWQQYNSSYCFFCGQVKVRHPWYMASARIQHISNTSSWIILFQYLLGWCCIEILITGNTKLLRALLEVENRISPDFVNSSRLISIEIILKLLSFLSLTCPMLIDYWHLSWMPGMLQAITARKRTHPPLGTSNELWGGVCVRQIPLELVRVSWVSVQSRGTKDWCDQ